MSILEDAADELAKDIVSIATSTHLEDLRDDMISNAYMKTFFGDVETPTVLRLALAAGVISRLGATIAALTDALTTG